MTVDHMGEMLFPEQIWMRCVGRLAFVLYAFLLTEGYVHTHDVRRYLLRLGVMALISEVPFDLMAYGQIWSLQGQNVYFTLFLGLAALYAMDAIQLRFQKQGLILSLIPAAAACVAAALLRCDYEYFGVLMILIFYLFREEHVEQFIGIAVIQALLGVIQLFGLFAFLPIACYTGERGKESKIIQTLFYFYYPIHILVIYGISCAV